MAIDLSLDRIKQAVLLFEPYTRSTIHVAGTNGKGSVTAMLTQLLISTKPPLRVGRFNSPYLISENDCISIDNKAISTENFELIKEEVKSVCEKEDVSISEFERLTLMALLVFERQSVDIVVLEVGMGGRLDATNIIPDSTVLLSIITSIDLDHQAYLGSTVSAIANEKAGIIRRGKSVILGLQRHSEVEKVVQEVAESMDARVILAPSGISRDWDVNMDGEHPKDFSLKPFRPPPPTPTLVQVFKENGESIYPVLLSLHGRHQLDNLGIALTALHVLRESPLGSRLIYDRVSHLSKNRIHDAVKECSWPGRLSFLEYPVEDGQSLPMLVDGAHNEAGAKTLASYVFHLLSLLSLSQSEPSTTPKRITITYILALSHSPPKTPFSVLYPILSPLFSPLDNSVSSSLSITYNVILTRFSHSRGPWPKPVSLTEMVSAYKEVIEKCKATHTFTRDITPYVAREDEDLRTIISDLNKRVSEDNHLVVLADDYKDAGNPPFGCPSRPFNSMVALPEQFQWSLSTAQLLQLNILKTL